LARIREALAVATVAVAIGATPAVAQDVAAGRGLVEEWCSDCHNITATGRPKQIPPDFAEIARYRPPDWIRAYIISPHPNSPMPTRAISLLDADQLDAIVAYIASLDTSASN